MEVDKIKYFSSITDKISEMKRIADQMRAEKEKEEDIENFLNEWEENHWATVNLREPRSIYELWRMIDDTVQNSTQFIGEEACDHFGITDKVQFKNIANNTVMFYFGLFLKTSDPSFLYIWFESKDCLPKKFQDNIGKLVDEKGIYFSSPVDDNSKPITAKNYKDGGIWFPLNEEYFKKFFSDDASAKDQREILQNFFDEVTELFLK